MNQSVIIVSGDQAGAELVKTIDGVLTDVKAAGGPDLRFAMAENTEPGVETHIWQGLAGDQLRLVEDEHMDARYLLVSGGASNSLIVSLKQKLKHVSDADILDFIRVKLASHPEAILLLGIDPMLLWDREITSFVTGCLKSTDPQKRLSAINAIALKKDPVWLPVIERAAFENDSAEIANAANYAGMVLRGAMSAQPSRPES